MAHEILSVKLCELEDKLTRLSSRIHLSESASQPQLQLEIQALRRECAETELTLQTKLQHSRVELASILANTYEEMERSLQAAHTALQAREAQRGNPEEVAEGKILLAEYALDFAFQSANRALLLAMEAIEAQNTEWKGANILP